MAYYSTSTATDYAWTDWTVPSGTTTAWANRTADTGTATSSITAWVTWTTRSGDEASIKAVDIQVTDGWYAWSTAVEESQEQKRARQAQAEINRIEAQRVRDEAEDVKKQAELTAQELLKDLISEDEMESYLKTGMVLIKGKKNDYILTKGMQAGVIRIDKDKVVSLKDYRKKIKGTSFCVRPENQYILPETDKIVAMKVALEAEEDNIMKMANRIGERELDLAVGWK